jgi:prepilin-type processing-associated H-X9-DG protein/prepilin-type N-terminal cleavage/methylation domain-containing protein
MNCRSKNQGQELIRWRFAFTLIEMLVVIGIIALLAAILLPTLAKAKENGRSINCVSNLRQLQLCWQMYADDYAGALCPNDDIDMISGGNGDNGVYMSQTSWCQGDARTDTNTAGIQGGLLYPYNTSPGIYHCPSDMSTIQDQNGTPFPPARVRSYNMSQSVNGLGMMIDPNSGYPVDTIQPCFEKLSTITNPPPSQLFVFIDENEFTLQDDQFGYPMVNYDYGVWWDMPSNRHNQGANLSFADGHVEHWHWQVPKNPTNAFQTVTTGEWPDYIRVGNAMRQIPIDFSGAAH